MCGISGIVNLDLRPVDEAALRSLNDPIRHRGPDGEGYFVERNVGFAHRRLSILDLRHEGDQPMHRQDRYVIVFNGEIYNYIELRELLRRQGHTFATGTDTEVILAAYCEWGPAAVERFNGMWAFALLDRRERKIFCSRDRFGIKPFHFRRTNQQLLFGSEIKQLLPKAPRAHAQLVAEYLCTGMLDHEERTLFEGVERLPASHNLHIDLDTGEIQIRRYYELAIRDEYSELNIDAASERLAALFDSSIEYRLRSDVKVGTCLSGGVDSSSVASVAARRYVPLNDETRFSAITAIASEKAIDESHYARMVVDANGLDWHTVRPRTEDFIRSIDEVVHTQEEPFGSMSVFMQYFVMQEARRQGCKVMLDGQAGDETFLGYQKYFPTAYLDFARQNGLLQAWRQILGSYRNHSGMSVPWILAYSAGTFLPAPRKLLARRQVPFMRPDAATLVKMPYYDDYARAARDGANLQRLEIAHTNLPVLLRYEDRNSMRHSVEARLPFMDYRLVEFALSIPTVLKVRDGWTKYIVRRTMANTIPETIAWRRDNIGFNAPDKTWLDGHIDAMRQQIRASRLVDALCEPTALARFLERPKPAVLWRLFNLSVWERVYDVRW